MFGVDREPIWVFPDGYILFETFTNLAEEIEDFLITISEPVVRTQLIHEYVLTPYALYAAVTSGINGIEILQVLKKFSKNFLPKMVKKMIIVCTKLYGKLHLILYKNFYFIFSSDCEILKTLLTDESIGKLELSIVFDFKEKNLSNLPLKKKK